MKTLSELFTKDREVGVLGTDSLSISAKDDSYQQLVCASRLPLCTGTGVLSRDSEGGRPWGWIGVSMCGGFLQGCR
jgi:hypothetical protein